MNIKALLNNMKNWLKRKAANISLALMNVEKNVLNQDTSNGLNLGMSQESRHTKGTLADALVHGERTQEVENLLWRTYKILDATQHRYTKLVGYDENNRPIRTTNSGLRKSIQQGVERDFSVENSFNGFIDKLIAYKYISLCY